MSRVVRHKLVDVSREGDVPRDATVPGSGAQPLGRVTVDGAVNVAPEFAEGALLDAGRDEEFGAGEVDPAEGVLPGRNTTDLVIVTGVSGGGRSTVARALENVGYYVVDN